MKNSNDLKSAQNAKPCPPIEMILKQNYKTYLRQWLDALNEEVKLLENEVPWGKDEDPPFDPNKRSNKWTTLADSYYMVCADNDEEIIALREAIERKLQYIEVLNHASEWPPGREAYDREMSDLYESGHLGV